MVWTYISAVVFVRCRGLGRCEYCTMEREGKGMNVRLGGNLCWVSGAQRV